MTETERDQKYRARIHRELLADRAERVRIETELKIALRLCAEAASEEQDALCSGISLSPDEHDALMKKVSAALTVAHVAGVLRDENGDETRQGFGPRQP